MSNDQFKIETYDDLQKVAEMFFKSGMFADTNDAHKAAVKILAGKELGIPPFAAMANVRIIKGNIAIGATLLATLLRRAGYDYQVVRHDDEICVLKFFRGKLGTDVLYEIGDSSFSLADARQAQLMGSGMYGKFPRNMLFSRALSNGVKWHCPEITIGGGPLYTPDELDETLDNEGNVIGANGQPQGSGGTSSQQMAADARAAAEEKKSKKKSEPKSNVQEIPKQDAPAPAATVGQNAPPQAQDNPQQQQQQQQQAPAPSTADAAEAAARETLKKKLTVIAGKLKCSQDVRRACMEKFWLTYFGITEMKDVPKDPALLIKAVDDLAVVLVTPEDYEAFVTKTEAMAKIAKDNGGKPVPQADPTVAKPADPAPAQQAPANTAPAPDLLSAPAPVKDDIDVMFPNIPAATKDLAKLMLQARPSIKLESVKTAMIYLGAANLEDYPQLHAIMQVIYQTNFWQKLLSDGKKLNVPPATLVDFIERKTKKAFADLSDEQLKAFTEMVLPNFDRDAILAATAAAKQ